MQDTGKECPSLRLESVFDSCRLYVLNYLSNGHVYRTILLSCNRAIIISYYYLNFFNLLQPHQLSSPLLPFSLSSLRVLCVFLCVLSGQIFFFRVSCVVCLSIYIRSIILYQTLKPRMVVSHPVLPFRHRRVKQV